MAGYLAKQGALAIAGAIFAHSKADEMPTPPAEHRDAQAMGSWATAMALFQPSTPPTPTAEASPQASAPAPPPPPAPLAPSLPPRIRELLGLAA